MHGVVNKAIESFVRDTYAPAVWEEVSAAARLGTTSFEAMLLYDADTTDRVIDAAVACIGKPRDALLEDLGIYLVSHPRYEALRRLLRFDIVPIRLHTLDPGRYELCCGPGWTGFGHVLAGGLRAMADDYGALVTMSLLSETEDGHACLELTLHETHHSRGRSFDLTARPA